MTDILERNDTLVDYYQNIHDYVHRIADQYSFQERDSTTQDDKVSKDESILLLYYYVVQLSTTTQWKEIQSLTTEVFNIYDPSFVVSFVSHYMMMYIVSKKDQVLDYFIFSSIL